MSEPTRGLRPIGRDDVDAFHAIHSDPRTFRHLPEAVLTRREQSVDVIERDVADWETVGLGQWAVLLDDAFVGAGGVMPRDVDDELTVGWWNLGFRLTPPVWGSGLGTWVAREGVLAAREHAPDAPVVARSLTTNPASGKVSEKAGLQKVHEGPSVLREGLVLVVHADRDLSSELLGRIVALG